MGIIIIDTLQRGGSGTSPFPVILEQDSSISYVTVADVTTRDAIPEWKRRSNMQCFVISTGLAYRLGTDLTIAGQVWTEIPGVGSGFQLLSEKGQVDGYVPLDGLGKIDPAYINNIYSNDSYTAASEAAMLALTTQTGDIVTRTDSSQIFVKLNNNGPPAIIGDFAELLFPGVVLSVNGLTGAVSITFTSLLAWASNQTEFDAAVTANTTVAGNSGAITINQTDISTLQSEVLALQNATKQITDFDSGVDYVVTIDYVVFPEATSGILELFKCIQSTSAPSPDPTDSGFWERVGDYLTTTEIGVLLDLKADLVAGVVPLAQLPPEVFSGTVIVADIAFRDAYTPKNVGLVFYVKDASADPEVTTGAAEYIYKPSDPLADGAGFVLKENPGTDDIDEGSSNLYYTEARVDANTNVDANTTHRSSDGKNHSDVVANNAKVSAAGSVDTHSDVDITTAAIQEGQILMWVSGEFVPVTFVGGGVSEFDNIYFVSTLGDDGTAVAWNPGEVIKPYLTVKAASLAAYTDSVTDGTNNWNQVYVFTGVYNEFDAGYPEIEYFLEEWVILHHATSSPINDDNVIGHFSIKGKGRIYAEQVDGSSGIDGINFRDAGSSCDIQAYEISSIQVGSTASGRWIFRDTRVLSNVWNGQIDGSLGIFLNCNFPNGFWQGKHNKLGVLAFADTEFIFPTLAQATSNLQIKDKDDNALFTISIVIAPNPIFDTAARTLQQNVDDDYATETPYPNVVAAIDFQAARNAFGGGQVWQGENVITFTNCRAIIERDNGIGFRNSQNNYDQVKGGIYVNGLTVVVDPTGTTPVTNSVAFVNCRENVGQAPRVVELNGFTHNCSVDTMTRTDYFDNFGGDELVTQRITITDANYTDALVLNEGIKTVVVTLPAAGLANDWTPSAITGIEKKSYKFRFTKLIEQNVDLLATINVAFPESASGDPADGINPFDANFLNVVVGRSTTIDAIGTEEGTLLFNQLVY